MAGTLDLMTRAELLRLWRCAVRRPHRQLVLAAIVSCWTLAWVLGQVWGAAPTPLGLLGWTGVPLEAASEWAQARAGVLGWCAVLGGLSWAATTERAQLPALLGWCAVLVAGEAIGYQPAVYRALLGMGTFLLVIGCLSFFGRRAFVVDRPAVIPRDVYRAGVTAAVLTAVVPVLVPGLAVARLVRPYLTKPPRRVVEAMPLREAG